MIGMPGISSASTTTIPQARVTPVEGLPQAKLSPVGKEEERAFLQQIDQRTGAPLNLRAAVAAVPREADKLRILRKVDPNAKAVAGGNFVYTPPGASEPILFDPKTVRDMFTGDVVEALPFLGEMAGSIFGGTAGAAAGAASGAGIGAVPGAILGSGAGGGAARTAVEQAMLAVTGTEDPRSALGVAGDMAASAGASALGEGASRLAAPVGRYVAGRVRGMGAPAVRVAADQLKVPLTAGLATGSRFLQNIENALASFPLTTGMMMGAFERTQQAAGKAAEETVQRMAGGAATGRSTFTQALRDAAQGRIARYNAVREAMGAQVDKIIGPATSVPVTEVQSALGAMQAAVAAFPNIRGSSYAPALAKLEAIVTDAAQNNGMVPFSVLREARSNVGKLLDDARAGRGDLTSEVQQALRDAYAAVTANVRGAADLIDAQALAAGLPTPGARQALDMHDAFVRLNRDPDNPVSMQALKQLLKANPSSPTQWVAGLANQPQKIAAIRKAVTPQEWDVMAASALEDMGMATAGAQNVAGDAWSPSSFLTNWNKMGENARRAMFGGTRHAAAAKDIEALARVAGAMREGGQFANRSNTTRALMVPLMLGGAAGAVGDFATGGDGSMIPAGAGAVAIGSTAAALLLTNRPFLSAVRWAVTEGAERAPALLARLTAIGKSDPALRDAVNEYITVIGANGYPVPKAEDVLFRNAMSGPGVSYTPR